VSIEKVFRGALLQRTLSIYIIIELRIREEITLHFQESRRPCGKARGERIEINLTDEQRSQAGWIGSLNCGVFLSEPLIAGAGLELYIGLLTSIFLSTSLAEDYTFLSPRNFNRIVLEDETRNKLNV